MKQFLFFSLILVITTLACGGQGPVTPFPTPPKSVFDSGQTTYGFFPSPPEVSFASVLKLYKDMVSHADFVLVQQNVPWNDFVTGINGQSQKRTDIANQIQLARQNNLEVVFVVDPLNGLNRTQFMGLPVGWQASFADPKVRTDFKNFALWIIREFHPRYLGLASEINTYADAHPDDFKNFINLYNDTYASIKADAADTKLFVTFQWEELNNLIPQIANSRQPVHTNWDQVEAFEPDLDIWAISSYPFVAFKSGADIPADYYTPLLSQTSKPLAVAEGGFTSKPTGPFMGTPEDQIAYLNAIHHQIGGRLTFWVYLLLNDFDLNSYARFMQSNGQNSNDVNTLGMFTSVGLRDFDGTPKPAIELWDSFRNGR